MSSPVLEHIQNQADTKLAVWAELEAIAELWVGPDMPFTTGQTGRSHKTILAPQNLMGKTGTADPWKGLSSGAAVRLRVIDGSGYVSGLLGRGIETELDGALGRADATINVIDTTGFPSAGTIYVGNECVTYTGKTATSFTGCTRAVYSVGYATKLAALPDGKNPLRVATTPWRLEGRYVRIWAMPINAEGKAIYSFAEAQEIWVGNIDHLPLALDGVHYMLAASGLEKALQSVAIPGNARCDLLHSEGLLQMDANGGEVYQSGYFIGRSNNMVYYRYVKKDAGAPIQVADDVAFSIAPGMYSADDLSSVLSIALKQSLQDAGFPEFADSVVEWVVPLTASLKWSGLIMSVNDATPNLSGEFVMLGGIHALIDTIGWQTGLYDVFGNGVTYQSPYDPGNGIYAGSSGDYLKVGTNYAPWVITAAAKYIPVIFPEGPPDWPSNGKVRVGKEGGEMVIYSAITSTGVSTPEGWTVYEIEADERGAGDTQATGLRYGDAIGEGTATLPEIVPVTPISLIQGDTVFAAALGLLAGVSEAGVNGTWGEQDGAGIYESFIDVDAGELLAGKPPISGYRGAVADDTIQAASWLADNLAVEGYVLTPGFVGTRYLLTFKKLGLPGPASATFDADVDWSGSVEQPGGLGKVVNIIGFDLAGGRITKHDLPSQVTLKVKQARSFKIGQEASLANLFDLELAADRLFYLFGRPGYEIDCPLGSQMRHLLPGDYLTITAGKTGLSGAWLVLESAPCWVPGNESQRVRILLLPPILSKWYAPTGKVVSAAAGKVVILPNQYSAGQSPIYPWTDAKDIHFFYTGGKLKFWTPGSFAAGPTPTLLAVDISANEMTLDSIAGISANMLVTYDDYADVTAAVQQDYIFTAPAASTYSQWSD